MSSVEADFCRSPRPGTRLPSRARFRLPAWAERVRAVQIAPTPLYSTFARVFSRSQGSDHNHAAAASSGANLHARARPSSVLHPPPLQAEAAAGRKPLPFILAAFSHPSRLPKAFADARRTPSGPAPSRQVPVL